MSGFFFGVVDTGKRGKERAETNAGKSFNRARYSGFDMSGDVHIRICGSFSKTESDREISGTKMSSTNTEASSPMSEI